MDTLCLRLCVLTKECCLFWLRVGSNVGDKLHPTILRLRAALKHYFPFYLLFWLCGFILFMYLFRIFYIQIPMPEY